MRCYGLILSILLAGCSSVQQKLDPKMMYPRDLRYVVNEIEYEGVNTIPWAPRYEITILPRAEMTMVAFVTSARSHIFTPKAKGWTWGSDNSFEYVNPDNGVGAYIPSELEKNSPLQIDAYSKETGQHSWAFMDFCDPANKLDATLVCNGGVVESKNGCGVSTCQSRSGLLQKISFLEPVYADPDKECALPKQKDNGYTWELHTGQCVYAFVGRDSLAVHRATFIGYEGILVREIEED